MTPQAQKVFEKVCLLLEADATLKKIGFRVEKVQRFGTQLRSFCPIHKDEVIRTLTIDLSRKTFRCSYGQCPGHKGGNLIDLFMLSRKTSLGEAVLFWARELHIPTDHVTPADFAPPEETEATEPAEPPQPVDLTTLLAGYQEPASPPASQVADGIEAKADASVQFHDPREASLPPAAVEEPPLPHQDAVQIESVETAIEA
ncbi:MAG: hypothetical protein H3C63_14965, partial [Candidatus Omnitrophica bacterium]|nr:hypothetical protein [Candidatus Omnitrophota bacterium]